MDRPKRRFQFNGEVTPAPEPVGKPKVNGEGSVVPKVFLPDREFGNLYEFQLAFMFNFFPVVAHYLIRNSFTSKLAAMEFQQWMRENRYELRGVKNSETERWLKIVKDKVIIAVAQIPEKLIQ